MATISRRQKKRQSTGPMPAAGAGLLRFFDEDTPGIQVKPEIVIVLAVALIIVCLVAQLAS